MSENTEAFAVGEVAVIAVSYLPEFPVGMEVTVLRVHGAPGSEFEYVIHESRHDVVCASRRCLRKKRPPPKREEVGDWELCPWQPRVEVAT